MALDMYNTYRNARGGVTIVKGMYNASKPFLLENVTLEQGRKDYLNVYGHKPMLTVSDIQYETKKAQTASFLIFLYLLASIWHLDIYGLIFSVLFYIGYIVIYLQYALWMNKHYCLVTIKTYAKHIWKNKMCWIWSIIDLYNKEEK